MIIEYWLKGNDSCYWSVPLGVINFISPIFLSKGNIALLIFGTDQSNPTSLTERRAHSVRSVREQLSLPDGPARLCSRGEQDLDGYAGKVRGGHILAQYLYAENPKSANLKWLLFLEFRSFYFLQNYLRHFRQSLTRQRAWSLSWAIGCRQCSSRMSSTRASRAVWR